jgi:hypothetical protein
MVLLLESAAGFFLELPLRMFNTMRRARRRIH